MTCSIAKKRYIYFHPHSRVNKEKIYINQQEIIEHFDKIIHLYCIPKELQEPIKENIKQRINEELQNVKKQEEILKRKITNLDTDIDKLTTMRMNEELTSEEFIRKKNNLVYEKANLQESLKKLNQQK
jgi:hypothetical protein